MKSVIGILSGVGIGAALMYLFDPDRGNRRRALIRDKAYSINKRTTEAIAEKTADLRNRAKGLVHETKKALTSGSEDTQPSYPPYSPG